MPVVEGLRIVIQGTVQGVGFRPWVYRLAVEEGLTGSVRNDSHGVTIEAFGLAAALAAFARRLRESPPPAARITQVETTPMPAGEADAFVIVASRAGDDRRISIPPDLATCPDCAGELADPADRRYRYPFTNCTNCGPRFTIALDVPYDRPATTMRGFVMCPACQSEYDTPTDRRFHAQPNACPVCGPRLSACRPDGTALDVPDAIAHAAAVIAGGGIVAVKGLGGFHLACDATSDAAVALLRTRKHRDEKPFAVMVATLDDAAALAEVDAAAQGLLTSVERPIVLLARREPSPISGGVAPGNPLVGLMLPYTPLHHLLLRDAGSPLVMTSGNLSDEPIVHRNEDAVLRLGPLADLLVLHDRDIVTRCDDSVARIIGGAPALLRRSRGYVPRAVHLPRPVARPVLAVGALLKNTCCLARGDEAFMGPHVGDLDNLETFRAFEDAVERMVRFVGVTPEVIAYDLHPGYHSTRFALDWPGHAARVGVQHHHAHVASAMAEHGLEGPVIGVAYDGTGYGSDGTAWGGEVLVADGGGFRRVATLRPLALPGVDAAIRAPWRIALAALDDAFGGEAPLDGLAVFGTVPAHEIAVVRRMVTTGVQTARAHGAGRYFDVGGALVLGRTRASYEGQLALELNAVADPGERGAYPYALSSPAAGPVEIDLRPMVRALADDVRGGSPRPQLAARFHRTLAAATAAVVQQVVDAEGPLPIVLSGGCFQNAFLAEDLLDRLPAGRVSLQRQVPPGDGGLALGQAWVANSVGGSRVSGPGTRE